VSSWASSGRIIGTVVAAVVVGIIAFVMATSSGAAADVIVDGGGDLPGTTDGSAGPTDPAEAGVVVAANADPALVVEIVGAVPHPGVYRLPAGSRVGDLVAAAGGYGGRVDAARAERELNQASKLQDGDQVRVPARGDPDVAGPAGPGGPSSASGDGGLVDLNTATEAQLDALPGIGPVTVAKIVAARDETRFATVEDLRTRGLVGQKTFDAIRESLVVR
jgi:competence protein ComEA